MKKTLIASCIALFALGVPALAQNGQQPTPAQKTTVQDDIRATSAELKEAYGILSQDLARLTREIGPDANAATKTQADLRDRMKATQSQLEAMLTNMSSANEEQWPEMKAKAATIRTAALDLVKEHKDAH